MKKHLIIFLALVNFCLGQVLVTLETKTFDEQDAGMNLGDLDLIISNNKNLDCSIISLDNAENNFQKGQIDVFEGAQLQDCLLFEFPDHQVINLRIQHHGTDGWKCEWVRLIFDDNQFIQCANNRTVDNSQYIDIKC